MEKLRKARQKQCLRLTKTKVEEKQQMKTSNTGTKEEPFCISRGIGISHNDPAQSDTFPYAVKMKF